MVYNRRRGVRKFPFIMSALAKLPKQDLLLASMPGWACSIYLLSCGFPSKKPAPCKAAISACEKAGAFHFVLYRG